MDDADGGSMHEDNDGLVVFVCPNTHRDWPPDAAWTLADLKAQRCHSCTAHDSCSGPVACYSAGMRQAHKRDASEQISDVADRLETIRQWFARAKATIAHKRRTY